MIHKQKGSDYLGIFRCTCGEQFYARRALKRHINAANIARLKENRA